MSDIPFWSIGMPLAVAMLVACWIGWRGRSVSTVVLLVLLVWVWLRVDKRFEGTVLIRVTEDHGLVLADLFGLAVLAFAGALLLRTMLALRRA
ncbi:MAG: hypothetical protein AVDCRST_MAG29-1511 [uncultured Nocardioidaceae bacterium]|uniref:Uncharacterized protein n=1 Tax=uncultured Nocardioidaceae bacterium TaxID=253824 RepID=A0A6J4LUY6_9ACTN|nr:MAG: hypothetical protein AVDCRST_MAG29-1511 [uncultured Nocardioidaceae bacterium]